MINSIVRKPEMSTIFSKKLKIFFTFCNFRPLRHRGERQGWVRMSTDEYGARDGQTLVRRGPRRNTPGHDTDQHGQYTDRHGLRREGADRRTWSAIRAVRVRLCQSVSVRVTTTARDPCDLRQIARAKNRSADDRDVRFECFANTCPGTPPTADGRPSYDAGKPPFPQKMYHFAQWRSCPR